MSKKVTSFSLEGRFLGFEFEEYKPKRLLIATAEGECTLKMAKSLRYSFGLRLIPGDWLQIVGEKKIDIKTGEIKLKAEQVIPTTVSQEQTSTPVAAKPDKSKASILVCQKSDCMKRGGKQLCQAMQEALSDRGLTDEVNIKGTGCLKHCKAGPNIVMMPDKTRYSKVDANQISDLIDKHFTQDKPKPAVAVRCDLLTITK